MDLEALMAAMAYVMQKRMRALNNNNSDLARLLLQLLVQVGLIVNFDNERRMYYRIHTYLVIIYLQFLRLRSLGRNRPSEVFLELTE